MTGRVLILEDDEDLAVISTSALTQAGYEVEVVATVEAAIASCEASPPDLALVDIRLPVESGWEFIRRVREGGRCSGMRLALHTVHLEEPETKSRAHTLGIDTVIGKGDPLELVNVVRRLTDG